MEEENGLVVSLSYTRSLRRYLVLAGDFFNLKDGLLAGYCQIAYKVFDKIAVICSLK